MNTVNLFVEVGKKKAMVGAVDWPGWCRSGRDEQSALQALTTYGPRYAQLLEGSGLGFAAGADSADYLVVERHEGNATTDFGAPAIILDSDHLPLSGAEPALSQALLRACWGAFDRAVSLAQGRELRKGPRGGGREAEQIVAHVLEADKAYLARLAWKQKAVAGEGAQAALERTRQSISDAVEAAVQGELPERGARGGTVWPIRYFLRRVAWHVLDHTWEIEDRIT